LVPRSPFLPWPTEKEEKKKEKKGKGRVGPAGHISMKKWCSPQFLLERKKRGKKKKEREARSFDPATLEFPAERKGERGGKEKEGEETGPHQFRKNLTNSLFRGKGEEGKEKKEKKKKKAGVISIFFTVSKNSPPEDAAARLGMEEKKKREERWGEQTPCPRDPFCSEVVQDNKREGGEKRGGKGGKKGTTTSRSA